MKIEGSNILNNILIEDPNSSSFIPKNFDLKIIRVY